MDIVWFMQIVAAVFLGNVITAAFLAGAWVSFRLEKSGRKQNEFPAWVYFALTVPLFFASGMIWMLTT